MLKTKIDLHTVTLTDSQLEEAILERKRIVEKLDDGTVFETDVHVRIEHNLIPGYTEGYDGFGEGKLEAYVRMEHWDFRDNQNLFRRFVCIDTTPSLAKKFIRNPQSLIDVLQGDLSNDHGLTFKIEGGK
ncbi:hypothetical protein KM908_20570 [Alkalihalobacillus clausii]|uniref:hypothetical protein n=1 Tax=Shouchella clausii TaxID=79880 RepID=UPI001C22EA96|nr:hypothetical protein [Shouchella clausii]MBU8598510.1 hypothetical protein [Shouchella clausii]